MTQPQPKRPNLRPFSSLSLLLVLACSKGQIGGEVETFDEGGEDVVTNEGDPSGTPGGNCEEAERTPLSDDEMTELGISVNDILALISGEHETAFLWRPSSGIGNPEVTPPAGDTQLTIKVAPILETAVFVDLEPRASGSNEGGPAILSEDEPCEDELQLEADVTVSVANGAFDDTVQTTFVAKNGLIALASLELEPGKVNGSFAVATSGIENAKVSPARLSLGFVSGGVSGTLVGSIESNDGQIATGSSIHYARFPEESCDFGYVLSAESEPGLMLQDWLDSNGEFALTWQNGGGATLSVSASVTQLCLGGGVEPSVVAQLTTQVKTDDERVDGNWALEGIAALKADGSFKRLNVVRQSYLGSVFSAANFQAESGIKGVESSAEQLSFRFGYGVTVGGDEPVAGELAIMELTVLDCAEPDIVPSSGGDEDPGATSPGCAGTDVVEIETATFERAK